ncbi:glycerophosphoryl diester phosphodiesterase membrane domain-containing protein [Sphaerisporangium sp. TRM90804]|uniref:DUF7544 domain-containing protein n=1 Tax=Sphaerisporangium sp. TRM90804 TaxID=3031113 RepID=UPI002449BD39|nr:glycerophosphoryl diester phosphodiesterase membrane domain-containing protein [Sphaerisporangium sp. TRM90804]MDH2427854.1 glycerophosphoryl diester phosphodiesterase membrane domain-containing protein [Sphaerisporangium sp. TRM90804]
MSDGPGSASSKPPAWAENQPPPYSGQGATPWTAPGDGRPGPGPGQGAGPGDSPPYPGDGRGRPPYHPDQPPPPSGPPQGPYGPPGQAHPYAPPGHGPGYGASGDAPPYAPPGQGPGYGPPGQGPPYGAPGQGPPYAPPGQGPGYGAPGQAPPYGGGPQGAYSPGPYGFRPPPQAPRPGIIPLRPLGLGDILDGTIKLIRSNPKATLGLSAIAAAIGTLPLAVGQGIYYTSLGGALADPSPSGSDAELPLGGLAAQLGGSVLSLIIQFFLVTMLTGLLTRVLGRAVFGGRISIGEAWRLTRSRLPALFGLALLTGLIALAPPAVAVVVVVAVAAAGASGGTIVTVGVLLALLCVAYVLVVTARFALASPAVVLEGRGVVDAMRRSWRLVDGSFWRVLGILLLTQLIATMLGGILSVPVNIVTVVVSIGGEGGLATAVLTTVLFTIGGILSAMITYPVQAGVNGLLYTDRRMRAEAFDLVLQTAAMQQRHQGWVSSAADDLWHPSHAAGAQGMRPPGPAGAP